MTTISERELRVLKILSDHEGYACYSLPIARKLRLKKSQVLRSMRSLSKKGLAEYLRGLFDEDGFTAGSGYACTPQGFFFLEERNKVCNSL